MRNVFLWLTLLLTSPVWSQDKLIFIVGPNVCTPITVNCGGRSYTVYSRQEVDRPASSITVTAVDCDGNKLKYDYGSDSGTRNGQRYSISTYTFRNIRSYESTSSGTGYSSSESNNTRNAAISTAAQNTASSLTTGIFGLGGSDRCSLQGRLGISRGLGTFATLRFAGKKLQLYASIGKDVFGQTYGDKISWKAGFGSYFDFGDYREANMDFALGLSVGHLAPYENLCFMIDVDYTWWMDKKRRVGLFAGGQVGWPDFINMLDNKNVKMKFGWDLSAGLAIRMAKF